MAYPSVTSKNPGPNAAAQPLGFQPVTAARVSLAEFALLNPSSNGSTGASGGFQQVVVDQGDGTTKTYIASGGAWKQTDGFTGPQATYGSGLVARQSRRPVESWSQFGGFNPCTVNGDGHNVTWQTIIGTENPFYAVRVLIGNPDAATLTVDATKISVSTGFNNANDPLGGAWTAVTFAGSASVTVPANTSATPDFGWSTSDWIPLVSVPWTGSTNSRRLLFVRHHVANANTNSWFRNVGNGGLLTQLNVPGGRARSVSYGTAAGVFGDYTSTSGQTWNGSGATALPMAIETRTSGRVVRVLAVGDSITEGVDSSSTWPEPNAFVNLACANLTNTSASVVYSSLNQGWGGQTQANLLARVATACAQFKPDICVFPAYSPNSLISSQAAYDALWANVLGAIDGCALNNVAPIMWTSPPYNSETSTQSAFRRAMNAAVLALQSYGVTVVDLASFSGNGADPEKWLTTAQGGTYSVDGLHPANGWNTIATAMMATAIKAVAGTP